MEKKINNFKIGCNILDIIAGTALILVGALSGFSYLNSNDAAQIFAFVILSVIFIPLFISFIIYGLILIIYGIANSIKIGRSSGCVTKKTGTIILIVFDAIFFALSLILAIALTDYMQIVRYVEAAILLISIIFKIVYLLKLKKFSGNGADGEDSSFEDDSDDIE